MKKTLIIDGNIQYTQKKCGKNYVQCGKFILKWM